jgi:hypothetical protein
MSKKGLNVFSLQTAVRLTVFLLGLTILSNCAYSQTRWEPSEVLVREPRARFEVEPNLEIKVKAIPGDLFIRGIDGNEAVASMEVRCPRLGGPCADHFEDLELDIRRKGNKLTIGANKGALLRGNSAVKTTLTLPRVDCLVVKIKAGSVDISGVDVNRLEVDMMAGDLRIEVDQLETIKVDLEAGDVDIVIPEDSVAELDLDAGVGDASIMRRGRIEDAPRSFLVGAQMRRLISREGARVKVDVQFGDIEVTLTP